MVSVLNDAQNHFSTIKYVIDSDVGHGKSKGQENLEILSGFGTTPIIFYVSLQTEEAEVVLKECEERKKTASSKVKELNFF